jgi:hypothetical protein
LFRLALFYRWKENGKPQTKTHSLVLEVAAGSEQFKSAVGAFASDRKWIAGKPEGTAHGATPHSAVPANNLGSAMKQFAEERYAQELCIRYVSGPRNQSSFLPETSVNATTTRICCVLSF